MALPLSSALHSAQEPLEDAEGGGQWPMEAGEEDVTGKVAGEHNLDAILINFPAMTFTKE